MMISTVASHHNPGGQEHSRIYSLITNRAEDSASGTISSNEWIQCYFVSITLPCIIRRGHFQVVKGITQWEFWKYKLFSLVAKIWVLFLSLVKGKSHFLSSGILFRFPGAPFFPQADRESSLDQNHKEREALFFSIHLPILCHWLDTLCVTCV